MTERNAIVTGIFGADYYRIADVSLPTIRAYANRIGAELFVLTQRVLPDKWHPYWEKLQLGRILQEYGFSRAAWIDLDTLVHQNAPSIFDDTPRNSFSALDEGKLFPDRAEQLTKDAAFYGVDEEEFRTRDFGYFNVGVMVAPWAMRGIFNAPTKPKPGSIMPEQTYLNLKLARSGFQFHNLHPKWNGFHSVYAPHKLLSELWIIHYAGWPKTSDWVDLMTAQMRIDLENWK